MLTNIYHSCTVNCNTLSSMHQTISVLFVRISMLQAHNVIFDTECAFHLVSIWMDIMYSWSH